MEEYQEEKPRRTRTEEEEKEDEDMGEDEDKMKDDEDLDQGVRGKKLRIGGIAVEEAIRMIEVWVQEGRVVWEKNEQAAHMMIEEAWDDVKGGSSD